MVCNRERLKRNRKDFDTRTGSNRRFRFVSANRNLIIRRVRRSIRPRLFDVLRLLGQNKTASEIADELHIAVGTVRTHFSWMQSSLGVSNMAELRRVAILWESGEMAIISGIPRRLRKS